MGKDREGKYHPPKGKPSGTGKEEGVGLNSPHTGSVEQYLEMADKYTEGASEMPANVKVRHPNRNTNKNEEKKQDRNSRNSYKSKNETFRDDRVAATPEELPGVLTREIFEDLAGFSGEYCISVYMPTHRSGVKVNEMEDNIAFKNALQQITNDLKSRNVNQTVVQKMLEPGYELLRNNIFWRYLDRGLAVFISDGYFKYVKMPDTPVSEVVINTSFLLKPLVNAMTVKEYFYLLAVSKKQAKFFRADNFGMEQLDIEELPNGVDDVVHFEEKDDQKLFRTESGQGGKGAAFHGHGAGKPDDKENIALYLEEVDDTLWDEVLHRENVPLLLAGVEYLLPIYKSVTDYNNVWPEVITGNQEYEDHNTLYEKARKVMEPYFRERTRKALEMYGNQSATSLTSSIPADIISAAHYSRIWHLFVIRGSHLWGTFNEMENTLQIHDTKQEGDECLIDKAVIKTILNGGDVHFVSREDMPGDSDMAAVMRY
jgi:hypothetical protein